MWSQNFKFNIGYDKKSCTEDFWGRVLNAKMRETFFDSICFSKKIWLRVIIRSSVENFGSINVETMSSAHFFYNFWWNCDHNVLNNSVTAQNFTDIPNFPDSRSYAKVLESQLVFCYHVLQCLFPVSQAVAFGRAVAFYVQAKETWEWKKNLQ